MMASRSSLTDRGQPPAKATALYARASATFDAKLAQTQALLRQAAALGADAVTQASSLGAEDVVITHLINALQLDIPIFVLETGALHTETLALLERTQAGSRAPVTPYRPETGAVMHFIRSHGQDAMYRSMALRKSCCGIRKLEPLARALAGKSAWITGLRREQSGARADMPLIDLSEVAADGVDGADGADSAAGTAGTAGAAGAAGAGGHRGSAGLTKFNPLAHWTWGDLWHYIATHGVDYNPLHDRFYPSIGCAPCTRAISLGEDLRSGRWWWEQESAKECGLHAKPDTPTVTRQKALP